MSAKPDDWRKGRMRDARPVSELAAKVLEPVIARRAGMRIDLLAAWADLVGPLHAQYTRPEKIIWPRRATDEDPFQPGQLVVACEGARAVLFQHEVDEILSRLNVYFGFQAIARIKIVQKPVLRLRERPAMLEQRLEPVQANRLAGILDKVGDDKLRQSLARLGKGVMSKAARARAAPK